MKSFVCDENKCCGCQACVNVCPKQCISLVDNVKSMNAVIDKDICIDCKMCEKVCQVMNYKSPLLSFNNTIGCYEGVSKNNIINTISSSGGFATTLGIEFAKMGGFVVGTKSDKDKFYFDITNNPDEVKYFSGSKYVKVSTGYIYKKIKSLLDDYEKVLFFGVPCQVAGLKLYLQKDYENLFTIDLICHGTPSEKVLIKYLKENNIDSMNGLSFRNKRIFQLHKDGKPISTRTVCDHYTIGFLKGLFYLDNCYECKYAKSERITDVTIGDSWGSLNENDSFKNLSLLLINTEKGHYLKSLVKDSFYMVECDYENAKKHNHQLVCPSSKQLFTDYFFENFDKKSFIKIINKAYPKDVFKQRIKGILVKLHLR